MQLIQAAALGIISFFVLPVSGWAQTLSTFGTPGLIDMPTAQRLGDGHVALSTSHFGKTQRNTLTFQLLPRVYGAFRYGVIRGFDPGGPQQGDRFDRSFDLQYQISDERGARPAIAVGLRDFGGTGIYSSEYLVATKSFGSKLRVTGGMGWGRLAQEGAFANPLRAFGDRFESRPLAGEGGLNTTGQLDFGAWFRGPPALFAGVEFQATQRLSFQVEYSSDDYAQEASVGQIEVETPFNFGLSYRYPNGGQLRAFVIGGTEIGLQYSYVLNPAKRRVPGGLDAAPLPLVPRSAAVLAGVDLARAEGRAQAEAVLAKMLQAEGMILQGFALRGDHAELRVENRRWDSEAQAAGRALRAMAGALPAQVERLRVTFQTRGVAISSVTLNRADFEELHSDYDGAWKSFVRAKIEDGAPGAQSVAGAYPRFEYGIGPYTVFSFFDPDRPLRYEAGAQLTARYQAAPGLSFSGVFRQPVAGNIADATRQSNSVIQRVRSDSVRYAQQSDFQISELTAEYMFRPGKDLFARITAGYLEPMYGGISGEVLWYPSGARLALGAEVNYAKQRDFDMLFGFQEYDTLTGHASAYYDIGNGFNAQLDVGRYLAGDWGATFALERAFNNGFKIGGYFTLTDVPFEDFGEGSFDKGIRVSIPMSWLTGRASRESVDQVIQPVLRDGGARLKVSNRLYEMLRDYRGQSLADGWGRVFQ
ncbi:MAG: YjbH domain-containing protein [Sulfitobacter sp.]